MIKNAKRVYIKNFILTIKCIHVLVCKQNLVNGFITSKHLATIYTTILKFKIS